VTPIDSTSSLNSNQKGLLESLKKSFPESSEEELLGYLKVRDFDVAQAKTQFESSLRWKALNPAPTIADVAQFLRYVYTSYVFLFYSVDFYHYSSDLQAVATDQMDAFFY
jgi:hypothetical protein